MQTFSYIQELQATLNDWRTRAQSIAFVPTMGGLHAGHLALVEIAKKKADKVVVSIFVNPTQFVENEDFDTYPRTLDVDLATLKTLAVDGIFVPNIEQIYPKGTVFNQAEFIDNKDLFEILCGRTRPHFFYGVLQVVRRLFEIIKPNMAIFGQKDYQQFKIIQKFTQGVEIIIGATMRENNGLAMSTRNLYLSADEHKIAPRLYQILTQAKQDYLQNNDINTLKKQITIELKKDFKLDYFEILDANTLNKITDNSREIAILCAIFLNSTRLIDNIIFRR